MLYCPARSPLSASRRLPGGTRRSSKYVAAASHANFLRATHAGDHLTATATPIHRGRSQQLWQVEITDVEQRLVARGEVRLQNLTG